jgi:hypothetical protein
VESLPERVPPEVQHLVDELKRHGYEITDERYDPDHFGDALVALQRDHARVRAVRDRGKWFVEIGASDGDDWFAPIIWKAFLEGAEPPLDAMPLSAQAQFVLDARDAIEVAARELRDADLATLRALRAHRAKARRALPPS